MSTNVGVVETLELQAVVGGVFIVCGRVVRHEQGAAEAMGIRNLAADVEITFDVVLRTYASAALGSCQQAWRRKDAPHRHGRVVLERASPY